MNLNYDMTKCLRPLTGSEFEKSVKPPKGKATSGQQGTPVFTKKENATLAQRIEILDWHHKTGKNQSATARHFASIYPNLQIKQPLVSAWLKEEAKWRALWEETSQGGQPAVKRVPSRQTEYPEVDEMMYLWVSKAMGDGILITGEVLRQKWRAFADLVGIPEEDQLKLSNGWLESFKRRNGLKEWKRHGEAGSADKVTVEWERRRIQARELIKTYGYKLRDIFNMDETGLFYGYAPIIYSLTSILILCRLAPDRGLSDRQQSGVKGIKTRLTYAFTCNADGSEKLPPFIIGKAAQPRPFQKKTGEQLGFYYRNNAKASGWMTTQLYQEWIQRWDRELQEQNRKILLLQDNFSGHVVPQGLQNIRVENFEPNLTAHVQPNDQGIIRCFKAHYRTQFIQRAVGRYDEGITPSEIYQINQLQAMRMADAAWRDVDTTTIRNCWKKAGILPDTTSSSSPAAQPSIPISALLSNPTETDPVCQAEKEVETALEELVATGALQRVNRMDIESLLNPAGESLVLTEASDQEIYQAVIDAAAAREKLDLVGHDDGDEIDSTPLEPPPSRRDIVKAISTINRYVEDLNDPLARKVEALLGTFNRHLRLNETKSLRTTLMTDYFTY